MCPQVHLMKFLQNHKLDEHNIVKFFGWFQIRNYAWYHTQNKFRKVLVFEMLDMTLKDYCMQASPLPLRDIRSIIQQVWLQYNHIKSKTLNSVSLKLCYILWIFLLVGYLQVATAMEALKRVGVIHTDLHLNNIMLVDHRSTPLRVKLIDFGFAIPESEAKPGMTLQKTCFR